VTAERAWRNLAPGVFLLGLGASLAGPWAWQWIFVHLAAMSVVNALVKRRWRSLPHGLLWGCGLGFSYATGRVGGWPMFWMLCGASIILSFLLSLVPDPPPPPPPPRRPGAGVVIDV